MASAHSTIMLPSRNFMAEPRISPKELGTMTPKPLLPERGREASTFTFTIPKGGRD